MIQLSLLIALFLIMIGVLLSSYRLIKGPTQADRILALDTLSINAIALLVVFGMWLGSTINFEAALLIAVLGFITTVALSKYLMRGDVVE
ncbi:MAG TPA: K+/H+ antiporter subunit F [Halothiobacillaceae bacterium]|nr:K+/H+ antiporter subunit F [Halothiobacillaceae bacterium]